MEVFFFLVLVLFIIYLGGTMYCFLHNDANEVPLEDVEVPQDE